MRAGKPGRTDCWYGVSGVQVVEVGWRHDIVRGLRPQNWLRDTNAEVVGLCEANGWGDRRVLQSLVHTSSRRGGEPSHSEMRSLNTNVNDPKGSSTRHVESRSCVLDGRTDMPCSQRWHRALPKLATPTPRCSQSRVATALVSGLHQSTPQRPRPPLMLVPIAACGLVLCVCACTLAAMLAVHPIKVVEQNDRDFERGMLVVKVHGML